MTHDVDRAEVLSRYAAYLEACNDRDWDAVRTHLADRVRVNGSPRTREEYVADITATLEAFPDYRWELQRAVVEGPWLAVRLRDTGTRRGAFRGAPGDGRTVETMELVMYRVVDGRIHEVEGTADNARLQA